MVLPWLFFRQKLCRLLFFNRAKTLELSGKSLKLFCNKQTTQKKAKKVKIRRKTALISPFGSLTSVNWPTDRCPRVDVGMVERKGTTSKLPGHLYDVGLLFPKDVGRCSVVGGPAKGLSPDTLRWISKSHFTCSMVGLLSKFWMTCK